MSALIVLILVLSAATPLGAQEVPARLTLSDALEIARSRNPDYRTALNNIEMTQAGERQRWGAFLPDLTTRLSLGGMSARTLTGEDPYGQPISLENPKEYIGSSVSQGMDLSMTLFDGLGRVHELRGAGAATDAAAARARAEAGRVRARVKRQYYEALSARRLVELERRLLASARDRLEGVRERLRVARTNPEDVLGARVDLARQEQAVEAARGDVRKARLQLRETMGVVEDVAFEISGEFPAVFDPSGLDADSLVRVARRSHPDVVARQEALRSAEHDARAARGARWPTVRASADVNRAMGLSSFEALNIANPAVLNPQNLTFRFSLFVTLPVFRQFETSAQIATADVARRNARERLRAARLAVDREVRSALIDVGNAHRSLRLAERSADLSRQRVEMAEETYRVGGMTFTDLQTLIDGAAEAERGAVQARLALARAVATLEEAVGREVRP